MDDSFRKVSFLVGHSANRLMYTSRVEEEKRQHGDIIQAGD